MESSAQDTKKLQYTHGAIHMPLHKSHSDIVHPQYLRMERYLKIGLLQIELDGAIPEKGEALSLYEWWCPYKEGKSGDRCIQVETKAEID